MIRRVGGRARKRNPPLRTLRIGPRRDVHVVFGLRDDDMALPLFRPPGAPLRRRGAGRSGAVRIRATRPPGRPLQACLRPPHAWRGAGAPAATAARSQGPAAAPAGPRRAPQGGRGKFLPARPPRRKFVIIYNPNTSPSDNMIWLSKPISEALLQSCIPKSEER